MFLCRYAKLCSSTFSDDGLDISYPRFKFQIILNKMTSLLLTGDDYCVICISLVRRPIYSVGRSRVATDADDLL